MRFPKVVHLVLLDIYNLNHLLLFFLSDELILVILRGCQGIGAAAQIPASVSFLLAFPNIIHRTEPFSTSWVYWHMLFLPLAGDRSRLPLFQQAHLLELFLARRLVVF